METDHQAMLVAVTAAFNRALQETRAPDSSPQPWKEVMEGASRLLATGKFAGQALYLRARACYYSGSYDQAVADIDSLLSGPHYWSVPVSFFVVPPARVRAMANIKLRKFSAAAIDLRDQLERLGEALPEWRLKRSDDYYWLLVCQHEGDEAAAMAEQAKFY